jgi:hypothetical protein
MTGSRLCGLMLYRAIAIAALSTAASSTHAQHYPAIDLRPGHEQAPVQHSATAEQAANFIDHLNQASAEEPSLKISLGPSGDVTLRRPTSLAWISAAFMVLVLASAGIAMTRITANWRSGLTQHMKENEVITLGMRIDALVGCALRFLLGTVAIPMMIATALDLCVSGVRWLLAA